MGLVLCLLFFFLWVPGVIAQDIALILSANLKPYLEFAEGFQDLIPKSKVYILPEDASLAQKVLEKDSIQAVAVGSRALALLKKTPLTKHIYYALLVSAEDAHRILPGRKLCGLYLKLPPSVTFPIIKETLAKEFPLFLERHQPLRVLIPYSAQANEAFVEKARQVGKPLGFEVAPYHITKGPKLKEVLVQEEFDLLYCVPDPLFATEEVISLVLETCLLRLRPACGYNHFFYRKGALLSFVFDYRQIGLEMARMLLLDRCEESPAPFEVLLNKKVLEFLHKNLLMQKHKN